MNIILSIIVILMAGLSTLIGTFLVINDKNKSDKKLGYILGLSAGIIFGIAIFHLLKEGMTIILDNYELKTAISLILFLFILGILLSLTLEKLIEHKIEKHHSNECQLCRIGITTSLMTILHKLPEGIVVFYTIYNDIKLGIPLALAIAIHHIPEGLMISTPIYYGTNNKKLAIKYSLISALSLPAAGILGYLILSSFINDKMEAIFNIIVAMIFLCLVFKEIIPMAKKYIGINKIIITGLIGMLIIAFL